MKGKALVVAIVTAVGGCGHSSEEAATITTPLRKPDRIVQGVPPGGFINVVALTEQADAALTIDTLGELRLWPSLDGKRQPIPIRASGTVAIALGHAGDELLVALLDQAGSLQLLRMGRDGAIRGKAQVPGDVAIQQVDAIDNGVIVERADQSIERYSADAKLQGRLVVGAGEKLGALAVRHGNAAVLITAMDREDDTKPEGEKPDVRVAEQKILPPPAAVVPEVATMLRWIVIGDDLRWGTSINLPPNVAAAALALSPNHHRIGVIDARAMVVEVLDLDPLPNRHTGPTVSANLTDPIGFADDDHLATAQSSVQWWTAPPVVAPDHDPWDITPQAPSAMAAGGTGGAVGDGLAVSGFGSSLALSDYRETRYLGWKTVSTGATAMIGSQVVLTTATTHVLWLDDQLVQKAEGDVAELPGGVPQYAVWVGPHQAIIERVVGDKYKVDLVDIDHPASQAALGLFAYVERIEYDADLHVLMIGTAGKLARFELDAEHLIAKPLPTLKTSEQVQAVRLLDPKRANGVIAMVTGYDDEGQKLAIYREAKPGAAQVRATKSLSTDAQTVLAIDATGAYYLRQGKAIERRRDGKLEATFPEELVADALSPSHDAARVVGIHGNEIMMLDANGTERWRKPLWGAVAAMFTTDDRRVIVRTGGGVVSIDVATGDRVAAVCGYGFGIATKAPPVNALGVTPVCQD